MTKIVEIYTDGACRGNPSPGGIGIYTSYIGKNPAQFLVNPPTPQ